MSGDNLKDNPPGSNKAIAEGCTCPRIDNHYGNGIVVDGEKQFWVSGDCPLHGKREIIDVAECD